MIAGATPLNCPSLPKISRTYLNVSNNMEDDKDKQGGSLPLSPTCLTNVVKDAMGQPLAPQKSKIINQKAKAAKWMAEVWWQPPEEEGSAATATAMATRMRTAIGTSTAMAMAMVTVMATARGKTTAMATAMVTATAMATAMVTSRAMGTVMAVAAAVNKDMVEG